MANKFKIKLKVTGFELEVEGSREDVPLIAQAVGQQMTGLLIPASNIVEGEVVEDKDFPHLASEVKPKSRRKRPNRQPSQSSMDLALKDKVVAVDWKHDSLKWGTPQQDWSTADKSIWLLYVVSKEVGVSELTGGGISLTFNRHFRQSRQIQTGQINRDLGKAKRKKPALVSEDTTKSPSAWFLTNEGEKRAQELITEALGGKIQND